MDTTNKLESAIERIFGDKQSGLCFLDLPEGHAGFGSTEERLDKLRSTLQGYVIAMADELPELGEEERPRLQAEARALLIALREIERLFPR